MTLGKVLLGDLFRVGSSKRVLKSEWKNEGIPFYRGREITRLSADGFVDNELYISEEHFNELATKYGAPSEGDIVITAIGTIGNSHIVRAYDKFYFKDASVLWLKKSADVSSEYINLWLKSPLFFKQLDKGNGATVDTLTIQKLQGVEINLPTLLEQQRIVTILDQAFEGIATATANAKKNLANAREIFESYLQSIFAIKGDGWVEKSLGDLGTTQTGSTPSTSDKANFGNYLPFIKPADFNSNGSLSYGNDGLSVQGATQARKIPPKSVLMVCIGATIGKCGWCDREIATNQQINVLTPIDGISHKLIYYQMLTQNFQQRMLFKSGQATLPIINKSKWNSLTVTFPSTIQEQQYLVARFDELSKETKKLEAIYQQKLTLLDELKKSILNQAFSGQLN